MDKNNYHTGAELRETMPHRFGYQEDSSIFVSFCALLILFLIFFFQRHSGVVGSGATIWKEMFACNDGDKRFHWRWCDDTRKSNNKYFFLTFTDEGRLNFVLSICVRVCLIMCRCIVACAALKRWNVRMSTADPEKLGFSFEGFC